MGLHSECLEPPSSVQLSIVPWARRSWKGASDEFDCTAQRSLKAFPGPVPQGPLDMIFHTRNGALNELTSAAPGTDLQRVALEALAYLTHASDCSGSASRVSVRAPN